MHMCGKTIRVVVVAYLVAALSGCASDGNLVRCDGRLEPINAPMPRTAETAAPTSSDDATRSDRE